MQIKNISINQSINRKSRVTGLQPNRKKLHLDRQYTVLYKHCRQPHTIWRLYKYTRPGQSTRNNTENKERQKTTNRSVERGTTPKEYKSTNKHIEVKEGWHNFILDKPLKRTRK